MPCIASAIVAIGRGQGTASGLPLVHQVVCVCVRATYRVCHSRDVLFLLHYPSDPEASFTSGGLDGTCQQD